MFVCLIISFIFKHLTSAVVLRLCFFLDNINNPPFNGVSIKQQFWLKFKTQNSLKLN